MSLNKSIHMQTGRKPLPTGSLSPERECSDRHASLVKTGQLILLLLVVVVGLWSLGCLLVGAVESGGQAELVTGWIEAVRNTP